MTALIQQPALDLDEAIAFSGKVAGDRALAYNAVLVYLGERLGLWRTLASVESVTSADLAERSGISERYAREWLSAQAAAGYVTYDAATRSFALPAEHAMVLADETTALSGIAGYEVIAAVWAGVDKLASAYATGEGFGWHEHDPRLFTGVDRFYKVFYQQSLLTEWLPSVDGLVERLESGIRVVDVGCGLGSATILMAQAFPRSTFVGVDYHEESIRRASAAALAAGVADRVTFEVGDAESYAGAHDLICYFDSLHDLGDPVGALRHARGHLAEGGSIFAVEPFAEDTLEANLDNPVALTFYVGSSLLCVPHSVSEDGLALGAQAGPARLAEVFREAGFSKVGVATSTMANLVLDARV